MIWHQSGLQQRGFIGFVPFAALPTSGVPAVAGVYLVYRPSATPPRFLVMSPAGHFKGRDPSVAVPTLHNAWVPDAQVVYIGKAGPGATGQRGLRKRLEEYRRFGEGKPVGHWGGRYIWQLQDSRELLVAWLPTPDEDCGDVEGRLIADFMTAHDVAPFANLTRGRVPT